MGLAGRPNPRVHPRATIRRSMPLRPFPSPGAATCALALLAATIPATAARAQCGLVWQEGARAAGPDGTVSALLPLPNGDVVAGGSFRNADGTVVDHIARWNGVAWSPVGSGMTASGSVLCLTRMPNGDLVAGGTFLVAGGVACNRIARWNDGAWAPFGSGLSGSVQSVRVLANGTLVAAGAFVIGGMQDSVAAWNGTAWTSLGSGAGPGEARALVQLGNGDLVVGGAFTGSTFTAGLRRWDGSAWTTIAGLDATANAAVDDLALRSNGEVVLNGSFRIGGASQNLAVWNGATMQPLALPVAATSPRALLALGNGDVLLGGTALLGNTVSLARWNGTSWQAMPGAPARILSLAEDATGRIVVGALAPSTFPRPATVSRFDGISWQALGATTPPFVQVMVDLPDGSVVVGGQFQEIGGVAASNIARWSGGTWSPLGLGSNGAISALAVAANGEVFAGGLFTQAGGAAAIGIARWDGQAWFPLGAGLPQSPPINDLPRAIGIAGNGDVLVALDYGGIQRFDGTQWSLLPLAGSIATGHAMVTRNNGDVVIGGSFNGFGAPVTGILIYSGGGVVTSPGAPTLVTSMVRTADDGVVVTGAGVQRWDGANWTQLPSAYIYDFAQLPSGDLIAAGPSTALGGAPTSCLYRLRANGWETWGDVRGGPARAVVATRTGDLLISGSFTNAGNLVACGLARATPACPASTVVAGLGCGGSAGPVALLAENDAWVGGTFRAVATGMTGNSLALQLLGTAALTPAVPLPLGAPGCSLWIVPVLSDVLVPVAGEAACAITLPNQPSLAGQSLHVQVLGLEFAATGLQSLTGTNALVATIGAF